MSYKPLSGADDFRQSIDDTSDWTGQAHSHSTSTQQKGHLASGLQVAAPAATSRSTATPGSSGHGGNSLHYASNYIHISDVGDILGTVYEINTDKSPAFGRFDSQEEQDQAANIYLAANDIDAEIRLSGSKKAKIEIHGTAGNGYGRSMIRITYSGSQSHTPATHTPFALSFVAAPRPSCLISLPEQYKGAITGPCTLSGRLRDEAVCLVADAVKSKWTVGQEEPSDAPALFSSSSTYPPASSYPTSEGPPKDANAEHSSVTFSLVQQPPNPTAGAPPPDPRVRIQRARRHVVSSSDYSSGLQRLKEVEDGARAKARRAYYIFGACYAALMVMIQVLCSQGGADWGTTVFLFVLLTFFTSPAPIIITSEYWAELRYQVPVTIPSV